MKPLVRRQYSSLGGPLTAELQWGLFWRHTAVSALPHTPPAPRITHPGITPSPPGASVGEQPDAQADGYIAGRFNYPGATTISTHWRKRFRRLAESAEAQSAICIYELCATILIASALSCAFCGDFPVCFYSCIIKQP